MEPSNERSNRLLWKLIFIELSVFLINIRRKSFLITNVSSRWRDSYLIIQLVVLHGIMMADSLCVVQLMDACWFGIFESPENIYKNCNLMDRSVILLIRSFFTWICMIISLYIFCNDLTYLQISGWLEAFSRWRTVNYFWWWLVF